jgi:hypothetical protein
MNRILELVVFCTICLIMIIVIGLAQSTHNHISSPNHKDSTIQSSIHKSIILNDSIPNPCSDSILIAIMGRMMVIIVTQDSIISELRRGDIRGEKIRNQYLENEQDTIQYLLILHDLKYGGDK